MTPKAILWRSWPSPGFDTVASIADDGSRQLPMGLNSLVPHCQCLNHEMESLEAFEPYTSNRLHWFPYEITRCKKLKHSVVSTRALYGNFKYRPSFPALASAGGAEDLNLSRLAPAVWGGDGLAACSVCGASLSQTGVRQAWISMLVATDVLPLLVNACSDRCLRMLPSGAEGYVRTPHRGGPEVQQPPTEYR